MNKRGYFFIFFAPSGSGKTTLANEAVKILSKQYDIARLVTYTTRKPRKEEKENIDYHFINKKDFLRKKREGFFLETTEYGGNYYGSPANIKEKAESGKSFIIVTDINGAAKYSELLENVVLIWIEPKDIKQLTNRLKKRGDTKNKIYKRIKLAKKEIAYIKKNPFFNHCLINDEFKSAIKKLVLIMRGYISSY